MALRIERVGYALGARVTGIDLRITPDDATMAQIRAAWLEHLVLWFPEQDISPEKQVAFSAKLGIVDDNRMSPLNNRHPDHPEVMIHSILKPTSASIHHGKAWDGFRPGERWHSDLSTTTHPTSATLLWCKERPKVGGDTGFANQYMAYETLSVGMQSMLHRLEAIHDQTIGRGSQRSPEVLERVRKLKPPMVQPAVRAHPETGRTALYVCQRVHRFKDMTEAESRPILEYLTNHAVQDEFVYRHRWAVGDLLMWDNRYLMHKAHGDYDMRNQPRVMQRTSVLGHKSGYYFAGDSVEPVESSKQAAIAN
jgi:taurine dioxygenase